MLIGDPRTAAETQDLLPVEPARRGEVDGFERRRIAELGRAQPPGELALLAGTPFRVDQQTQAFLEAERGGLSAAQLLLDGLGQGAELHGIELVERLFDQHGSSVAGQ